MSRLLLTLSVVIISIIFIGSNPVAYAQDAVSGQYTGFWYEEDNEGNVRRLALEGDKFEERKRKELTEYWTPMFRAFLRGELEAYATHPTRPVSAEQASQMIRLDPQTAQAVQDSDSNREDMALRMAEWSMYFDQLELWNRYVAEKVIRDELEEEEKITYNPATIKTDIELIYESLQQHAAQAVSQEKQRQENMLSRIENNRINLQIYNNWLDDRENEVLKYARQWARKYEGEELVFEDTTYLVRDTYENEMLIETPQEKTIIINKPVEQKEITPFDLLNEDGSLIKPEE